MINPPPHIEAVLGINSDQEFNEKALQLFRFQSENCSVYRTFLNLLQIDPRKVNTVRKIPFLPIELFKSHQIFTGSDLPKTVFKSSGTTGSERSHHYVANPDIYKKSFLTNFEQFYGRPEDFVFLALLPSYIEQGDSSLVYMMQELIERSESDLSGFYLTDYAKLNRVLTECEQAQKSTILLGVTYALLDFAEQYPQPLMHTLVMETGGMKGRKKEMIRADVHKHLQIAFQVDTVHSEYGMTELLSQAYSKGNGLFKTPPWMNFQLRSPSTPLYSNPELKAGIINIIDLANIDSCAFIATQDLGKWHDDEMEILGRTDHSDIRGCSQLAL